MPSLADCPVRFDYYSTNRDRTTNTDRSPKAPVPKALPDGKPVHLGKVAAGSKETEIVDNGGLAESTRDQIPPE